MSKVDDVRYVAYCDILGFSNRLLTDFDGTLTAYREFGDTMASLPLPNDVQTTIYSDALLITGKSLGSVLSAAQGAWFFALMQDLMLRGAITRGRYWEQRSGNSLLIASDALVQAVKLEHSVGIPAVVVADDVDIPDEFWLMRFARHVLEIPLLHFRDRNIVNPFNPVWFRSASGRARRLLEQSPAHRDKYLWFLALHRAVQDNRDLIPPEKIDQYLREGKVKRKELVP